MTESERQFRAHLSDCTLCLQNYDSTGHYFSLRHVWVASVSAFDWYLTELVPEVGLQLIDRTPRVLTANLQRVEVPLGDLLELDRLNPAEKLIFVQEHIFLSIQYKSFYRPDKVSEALSYILTCPSKEKWGRILARLKITGRYDSRTEQDIRDELTLIGDRRDLISHSVDITPGTKTVNPARRDDAARVIEFIGDLVRAIDEETERQLA